MNAITEFPPTPKGRDFEIKALGLRDFAGLRRDDQRLDPFELARYAKLLVVDYEQIEPFLSGETREELLQGSKDSWSGGACSQRLPDGRKLIILNPTHSPNRQNATLMEEISHVFLGHQPSRLAVRTLNKQGKTIARDYRPEIEEEAYGVGAAALVPFASLKRFIRRGKTSREIAKHFNVSRDLVEYRIKISKLWDEYASSILVNREY
ncbi:MAG TPA: ImmA/IrrE family metallo-endopeptidase [Pyrinomonadaceae bacterium]|nr:ImmA/IrrE family metallo-endopeptidase [Pyrinomonadaceae bacterium]HNU07312.1 ImmA/IrrE family metallo-endopeptidase [Pyrinomonadaceae bacterium]